MHQNVCRLFSINVHKNKMSRIKICPEHKHTHLNEIFNSNKSMNFCWIQMAALVALKFALKIKVCRNIFNGIKQELLFFFFPYLTCCQFLEM